MKKTLLIFMLLALPHITLAKKYDPPKLSAVEAIQVAKSYVTKNNISIDDASFISEVIFMNIYNEYQPSYWSVKWHAVPRVKGGWLEIRVYNSGKVEPQYGK